MKKLLILLLCIVTVVCLIVPTCTLAQTLPSQKASHKNYSLICLKDDSGNPYGVRFGGYYFGNSGIFVVAQVYSSDSFVIDFDVNGSDNNLTNSQKANKQALIALFDEFSQFIHQVDFVSNTNYDGEYSIYIGGQSVTPLQSDVYRYNQASQGQTLTISKYTYDMLQTAQKMYALTNGAYNPAVYRLVDLWGFSSRVYAQYSNNFAHSQPYDRTWQQADKGYSYPLPDNEYVNAFKNTDFLDFSTQKVHLFAETDDSGNVVYKVTKNVSAVTVGDVEFEQWIDLGGIAKGYVVDYANQMMDSLGIDAYYVDAGSSSQSYGKFTDGGADKLAIVDPFENTAGVFGLPVKDVNLSTSGGNNRYYYTNNVKYSHIIDGTTGKPVNTGIEGVTAISPTLSAAECDCLTTALTVMGRDNYIKFVNDQFIQDGANDNFVVTHQLQLSAFYQTNGGVKQILSNLDQNSILREDFFTLENFGWALSKDQSGKFVYDANSKGKVDENSNLNGWVIALLVVVGLGVIAIIVYHLIKGKTKVATRISQAKKDKFFKTADVMVYLCVALVIVILFSVFFANQPQSVAVVKVVDMQTNQTLFAYNVARGDFEYIDESVTNWQISVNKGQNIVVTFVTNLNGEKRKNVMTIFLEGELKVQMTDSVCEHQQACVRNHQPLTSVGRAIVCLPNQLKIITE